MCLVSQVKFPITKPNSTKKQSREMEKKVLQITIWLGYLFSFDDGQGDIIHAGIKGWDISPTLQI